MNIIDNSGIMRQPSIFLSHNYRDKSFDRTLTQDLSAMGVKVWLDEAELKVGDSLIMKVSSAIDEMHYLGVVLSPNSVNSHRVREQIVDLPYLTAPRHSRDSLPARLRTT